jgi:hypothetical protein
MPAVPDWLVRWAFLLVTWVLVGLAGFVKGCDHELTAKLQSNAERVRVATETIVKEVRIEKQAHVQFFGEWRHELNLEMAAAPVMPAVCDVSSILLNRGIDRANCAGRMHEPACSAHQAAGADGHAQPVESVDGGQPAGNHQHPQ